ncbi:MAG: GtrA family protein [Alphaproteobacteria bacterium]|nr:GtrA family protein [Alphaproteobacteria bacterium]
MASRLLKMKKTHIQAIKFVFVSGVGWLLDMCVYTYLVALVGITAFTANLVSGSCGALFSFIVSHERIFEKNKTGLTLKVPIYLAYTVVNIVVASFCIKLVQNWMILATAPCSFCQIKGFYPVVAKIIVTPFTLAMNFVVSRILSERFGSPEHSGQGEV